MVMKAFRLTQIKLDIKPKNVKIKALEENTGVGRLYGISIGDRIDYTCDYLLTGEANMYKYIWKREWVPLP